MHVNEPSAKNMIDAITLICANLC